MRLALLVLLVPGIPAAATPPGDCTPARMMVVLDHSSSMNGKIGTQTKWAIAKAAVTQVATGYESKIDIGLNVFPNPGQCSAGKTLVQPATRTAAQIAAALPGAPPDAGNYTPMSQTLDAVIDGGGALADATRPRAILLVTDGWQWCDPYDAATRFWPVDSVTRAAQKGIKVYVVGFGAAVDVQTLTKMAVAAGTALAGCDVDATEVTAPNKCYYQADSAAQLSLALDQISLKVSAEVCDGKDNDCDGQVDEDLVRSCATGCGGGEETCSAGAWQGCTAKQPSAEVCDGVDNDCNGAADEGCLCQPGTTRKCGSILGACALHPGKQTCTPAGKWGACEGATMPSPEVCNGIDDDCNGYIDDASASALCPNGSVCDVDGNCKDPFNGLDGAGKNGCACRMGGAASDGDGALLGLIACLLLALALRRRVAR